MTPKTLTLTLTPALLSAITSAAATSPKGKPLKSQHYSTIARLNKIAWLIMHRSMTGNALAAELGYSWKTIQRDLDFLRDSLGHDIEYDPINYRWFYRTKPLSLSDPNKRMLL